MTVRLWPGWRIVRELKTRRVRQQDIAAKVGCSTATVNKTIARKRVTVELCERVWKELEEVLG
jgi:hypothetical protein